MAVRAAAAILVLVLAAGASAATSPRPLTGVPLPRETGLRLLVADTPPFALDVDRGTIRRLSGIAASPRGVIWVVGVGGRAGVVVVDAGAGSSLYGVHGSAGRVSELGRGRNAWPASDGRSVWVQTSTGRSRCAISRVALDGRTVRAPRPFPCATVSDPPGGSLGLVVNRTRVLDPVTGRTVLRTRQGILAVAGRRALLAEPDGDLVLLDTRTGSERRLRRPSSLDHRAEAVVDPRGRFVALAYGNPAWAGGGQQVVDTWVVDTRSGELRQVPSMPAFVSLKRTNMAWTVDGRLVLLAENEGRKVVAVWRPGQERLALKTVRLPERSGGSDTFALLQ